MKRNLIGLGVGLAVAVAAAYATLHFTAAPSPAERQAAYEAFYAEMDEFSDRIQDIADPEIAEYLLAANFGHLASREMELARDYPDVGISYAPHDLAVLTAYRDLDAYADGFIGGITARWIDGFEAPYVNLSRPFQYPFGFEITAQSVTFADGRTFLVEDEAVTDRNDIQVYRNYADDIAVSYPDGETGPTPRSLQLSVTVDIPSDVTLLRFENPQVGDELSYDDFTVTITDMTSRYARVMIRQNDGGVVTGSPLDIDLAARDPAGFPIRRWQMLTGRFEDPETLENSINEVLALAKNDFDAAKAKAAEFAETPADLTTSSVFGADLAKLDVFVTDRRVGRTITREITLPVFSPDTGIGPQSIVLDADVIDPYVAMLMEDAPDVWTPDDLRDSLRTWQKSKALYFSLPPRVSDLLITEFDRLERHGDLEFGPGNAAIDQEDWRFFSIQPMRIDFSPENFPQTPTQIKGQVAFNILDQITRERFSLDALPDGMQVNANRISVTGDLRRDIARGFGDGTARLIALNADGKPLKLFREDDAQDQLDFYFYGNPDAVLLLRGGTLSQVVLPVDQELDQAAFDLEY